MEDNEQFLLYIESTPESRGLVVSSIVSLRMPLSIPRITLLEGRCIALKENVSFSFGDISDGMLIELGGGSNDPLDVLANIMQCNCRDLVIVDAPRRSWPPTLIAYPSDIDMVGVQKSVIVELAVETAAEIPDVQCFIDELSVDAASESLDDFFLSEVCDNVSSIDHEYRALANEIKITSPAVLPVSIVEGDVIVSGALRITRELAGNRREAILLMAGTCAIEAGTALYRILESRSPLWTEPRHYEQLIGRVIDSRPA